MINITEKIDCCGCQACFNACPCGAISMQDDNEGFLYPHIDKNSCIDCGLCEKVCPELSQQEIVDNNTNVYACYRSDYTKRLRSQSGGVFALLAEKVISQGGVVFGAAFDDSWKLNHICVDNQENLHRLLGSKYVQSDIGLVYRSAEEYLQSGKLVLFSGTPCQIQGFKKYLRKPYDNLLSVDLICHGIPSPKAWKNYLEEFCRGDKLVGFVQKDKEKNNASVYTFEQRGVVVSDYEKNPFIRGFNQNLYLRPSCHQCSFKGINRCSDITLGDFWGLERFYPEFVDKYGISAVIVHSKKGYEAFNSMLNELIWIECEQDMLTPENPCIITSSPLTDKRQQFFDMWESKGTIKSIRVLTKSSLSQRLSKVFNPIKWYTLAVINRIRKKKS